MAFKTTFALVSVLCCAQTAHASPKDALPVVPTPSVSTPASTPQPVPQAYVSFIPFEWMDYAAMTRESMRAELRWAIKVGLEKYQAGSTRKSIILLKDPQDLKRLNTLLQSGTVPEKPLFGEPRLLVDEEGGEREWFVDAQGDVAQGSRVTRLTPAAFGLLKTLLNKLYAPPAKAPDKEVVSPP